MALDKALERQTSKLESGCTVALLLEKLTITDQVTLTKALDSKIPTSAIVRAIREEGWKMSDNSMNAHRQGKCKCVTK